MQQEVQFFCLHLCVAVPAAWARALGQLEIQEAAKAAKL